MFQRRQKEEDEQMDVATTSSTAQADQTPPKTAPPPAYQFDPDDEFYLAPPTCQFFHYRVAAVIVGIFEVLLTLGALITSLDFFITTRLVGIWAPLLLAGILCIATGTTVMMIYGIRTEQAQLLWPQIYFLKVEISLLMAGAVFSIASMCMGIESTNWIFSHFVSISLMERQFGPIWPFNVAIVFFSGAAIGIWFDVIVRGCLDYLLDKEYFSQGPQPI